MVRPRDAPVSSLAAAVREELIAQPLQKKMVFLGTRNTIFLYKRAGRQSMSQ